MGVADMSVKEIVELEELEKYCTRGIWMMSICLMLGVIFSLISVVYIEGIGLALFFYSAAILFGTRKSYYDMKYNLIKYKVMKVK